MKKKWTAIYETTPDFLREQAKQSCGEHPLFALVELITNSNEAYNKLDARGVKHRGKIIIDIYPHHGRSKYVVTDFASGLDEKDIAEKVKKIGGDQSDLTQEIGGRSFYGRGLKESLINFGYGEIKSIKNNKLFKATSLDVELTYEGSTNVFQVDRDELGAKSDENCTRIILVAFRKHIQKTPQYENLKELLTKYFELRDILQNKLREVVLRYHKGISIVEERLVYNPISATKHREVKIELKDFPKADILLEIYEAQKDIPAIQEKYLCERGFLICSKNAIHAIEYFGLQYHSALVRLFGRITSNYIDFLMREKREILFDSARSGSVNTKNSFSKSLLFETQKVLAMICEEFSDKSGKTNELQDKETDDNVRKVLNYFNRVARSLLEEGVEVGPVVGKKPKRKKQNLPPPDGFNFMPPYIQAIVNCPTTITLKLSDRYRSLKNKLSIVSENKNIIILKGQQKDWDYNIEKEFWVFRGRILGKNIGDAGVVNAQLGDLKTAIRIETIEKNKGRGLFNDWAIERGLSPEQRVQYIRGTGKILISADAPSVKPFIISSNKLHSIETRVLIAELILNACCGEIARQMILRGKEPLLRTDPDGIAEQIQDLLVRLTNAHARVAQLIVTKGKLEEHFKTHY